MGSCRKHNSLIPIATSHSPFSFRSKELDEAQEKSPGQNHMQGNRTELFILGSELGARGHSTSTEWRAASSHCPKPPAPHLSDLYQCLRAAGRPCSPNVGLKVPG